MWLSTERQVSPVFCAIWFTVLSPLASSLRIIALISLNVFLGERFTKPKKRFSFLNVMLILV